MLFFFFANMWEQFPLNKNPFWVKKMRKIAPLGLAAALFFLSYITFAASNASSATQTTALSEDSVQKLLARTDALEQEVKTLKSQLAALQKTKSANSKHDRRGQMASQRKTQSKPSVQTVSNHSTATTTTSPPPGAALQAAMDETNAARTDLALHPLDSHFYDAVLVSPFLGLRSNFDASNLVINISDINTDLRLLRQHKELEEELLKFGAKLPEHPVIELSGALEGQGLLEYPYHGKANADVNLATAELDVAVNVNSWVIGFLTATYDDSQLDPQRDTNSRFFLKRGFITVGNLRKSPFYGTIGQMFIPTGAFESHMISSPVTKLMARTRTRTLLAGFQQPGDQSWNGSAFVFNGDTTSKHNVQYGMDLEKGQGLWGYDSNFGVTYTSNLAESDGMQDTGGNGFEGFGTSSTAERIKHNVPALDFHASGRNGNIDYIWEILGAVRPFSREDLVYENKGAKPLALNVELAYHFNLLDEYESAVALGYGYTKDASALNLPKQSIVATVSSSFWPSTVESIEFKHNINYSKHDIGGGRSSDGELVFVPVNDLGGTSDTITAQIGVYF